MSKLAKICSITGGIIAGIGIVLCLIGVIMGFTFGEFRGMVRAGDFSFFGSSKIAGYIQDHQNKEAYGEENYDSDENVVSYRYSSAEVKKLEIDVDYGDLTISTYEGDDILVETFEPADKFSSKMSGSTLKIKDKRKGYFGNLLGVSYDESYVHLYVPYDMEFDEIKLNIGMGTADIRELAADNLEVEAGAGTFYGELLTVKKEAEFENGAGTIELSQFTGARVKVESGMGYISIEGDITDKCEISCGIGSAELRLMGEQDDFNYQLKCGAGSINIGDDDYSGFAKSKRIDNEADRDIIIDCGGGYVQVDFNE